MMISQINNKIKELFLRQILLLFMPNRTVLPKPANERLPAMSDRIRVLWIDENSVYGGKIHSENWIILYNVPAWLLRDK